MRVQDYIRQKKAQFEASKERRLANQAQEAEKRMYKAEIEINQYKQIEEAKKVEAQAREIRNKNSFLGKFMGSVKENNTKKLGKPTLYGKSNLSSGSKGFMFGDVGTKFNPAGDYKGPFYNDKKKRGKQ